MINGEQNVISIWQTNREESKTIEKLYESWKGIEIASFIGVCLSPSSATTHESVHRL